MGASDFLGGLGVSPGAMPAMNHASMVRSMGGLALLGMRKGFEDDARLAMKPVATMTGDSEMLDVFMAFAAAMGGNPEPARELLMQRESSQGREYLDAMLSLSLRCAGAADWEQALNRVLAVSSDTQTRDFAHQINGIAKAYQ